MDEADDVLCVKLLFARATSAVAHLVFAMAPAGFAFVVSAGTLRQLVIAAIVVSGGAIVYRAFRLALVVDDDGVKIVNFWRTKMLSWTQIGRVGIEDASRFFATTAPLVSEDAIFFTDRSSDSKIYAEATMSTVMRPEQRQEILEEIIRRASRRGVHLLQDSR